MPEYVYRAADLVGGIVDGRLDAESREEALRRMRSQGLTPIRLTERTAGARLATSTPDSGQMRPSGARVLSRSGRIGDGDVLAFTNELAIMLRAGLPIDRALRIFIGMCDKPAFRHVVEDVFKAVKSGKGFSHALLPHQTVFGDFFINMVRSGEASGKLDEVLSRLAEHLERMRELRESVVSALIYPAILVVVSLLSVFLMLGFVVPQFQSLFDDMGEALPLPTRVIVALGNGVAESGWLFVLIGTATFWLFRRWLSGPAGAAWQAHRTLALPVFGSLLKKFEVGRFARTMGTLLENGVPIVQALRISSSTVGNLVLRDALADVLPEIKQGGRMAAALGRSGLFTELSLNMVRLGEETGRLDTMLLEIARVHDNEVKTGIKRMLALIEPVLILSLGLIIAGIIVSILMGIMSVNELVV